ncbi:uncharacterized protein PRCAT00004306001 [Priceomyces carsonii]|uniref:uncharacterized protein n=1 Tax=Priceomyces carsonii TaxID=28549 RepID=UPI002ED86FAA|nr:unnamed protein product [Priceomyces carsonii]
MTIDNKITPAWWKETSVYQIYPASYKDSTGNGTGDIPGITSKLDYIQSIGVDIVWLNPCFESPQVDMGYDISDYYKIDPLYGTLKDIDELIEGLHSRGMKLLMDLVVNHTSDKHDWFEKSRSSTDNEYRDWYIWRKPRFDEHGNRHPPNNWIASFEGSAWEFDERTGEYYLHLFAKEQPDLNWENPKVRKEVHKIIRFWLDRGADGFRMDVINYISKDQNFPDAEIANKDLKYQNGSKYYACGPRLHEYLKDIGHILQEYDAFSVGEMPSCNDPLEIIRAVNSDRNELSMIFNFEIVDLDHGKTKFEQGSWDVRDIRRVVNKWQSFMQSNGGWNAIYLENHDQPRSVSRYGNESPEFRKVSAKMVATFLALQQGTLFVYQGQELGLVNVPKQWEINKYRDIETLNNYNELISFGASEKRLKSAMVEYQKKSRDNARTPIPWNNTENAGFSTGKPWIDINESDKELNVEEEDKDAESVLNYWRKILLLRKKSKDIFVYGLFKIESEEENDLVLSFLRSSAAESSIVICNFSSQEVLWKVPKKFVKSNIILSNYNKTGTLGETVRLNPYEVFVTL